MRVYLGSDHAGFDLKGRLVVHLSTLGHDVVDCGPFRYDPEDDYPPFCLHTAARVAADRESRGVVLGGSGNGEQIAANKVAGVRAALAWNPEIARLAREHNDANVLGLGARMHTPEEAAVIVETFLDTKFSGAPRHTRRIAQIDDYEQTRTVPQLPV
jgi:ribose 5-phosphate isomerase B